MGDWRATFADPAVLADLRAAVREMAAEIDDCDPDAFMHQAALVHPMDVHDWIERELHLASQRPVRFERGHSPRRRKHEERLNLAVAR